MLRPFSNVPRFYLSPRHWWHSVLVLVVDDICFCNIPSVLIQSPASNSPRAVHSSLRLPCLWEQPKFATDTELITTDLEQCAYTQTTRSSAASHLNPECDLVLKMLHWRYASAIQILRNWRRILFLLDKAIHGVTEINTMLKIENLAPRNWRNVKTHHLIFGIKSEDIYGYVPDYTKPLTCIGCHIGYTFIRNDRVWLNIHLDNKTPRYRHRNRLPMLLGSKTTGSLEFWRLCQFILNRVIMKMING